MSKQPRGEITIRNAVDDAVIETINAADTDRVTIDGTQAVISPSASLPPNAQISITVDDDAFQSTSKRIFVEDFEGVELRELESDRGNGWRRHGLDGRIPCMAGNVIIPTRPMALPWNSLGLRFLIRKPGSRPPAIRGRDSFTLGKGNMVVADADEYDDITDIDDDQFNVFLTTPVISLAGQAADSARF